MRYLRPASEEEVVAAFLRAEAEEMGRHHAAIAERLAHDHQPPAIVLHPDAGDRAACEYRRRLLSDLRGFGRGEGMFVGFPDRVEWQRVALSADELLEIRYIDDRSSDNFWTTLSGGTRRPLDAAARIRQGVGPRWTLDVWDLAGCAAVVSRVRSGTLPELIAATTSGRERIVALEGNGRLTSFALFRTRLPDEIEVLCGVADGLATWGLY